jgi:ATP-dependent protease ClpP protease subunit
MPDYALAMASPAIRPSRPLTYAKVMQEAMQHHSTRKNLYEEIQKLLGDDKFIAAFFTSFVFDVQLNNADVDMLEEVFQNSDLKGKHLVLILNCPGGDGLAAERLINACRSYSTNGFTVLVPKQAKSAATMICLGANKIIMSNTAELGPIDPQVFDGNRWYAAHEIIEAYDELVEKATKAKGRIDPFLQQLQRMDATQIRWIKSAQALSENIAIKTLQTGIMKGLAPNKIKTRIKPFLDPRFTKSHGRPIYHDVAKDCGLDVQVEDLKSPLWVKIWELYVRLNTAVSTNASKIIESCDDHYEAGTGVTA